MRDVLQVLSEVKATTSLQDLHPLKLDRWHGTLLGVPERIYKQYGCVTLLEQVQAAATALRAMVDLLGADNLPVAPQELAQRTVQSFRWYVTSEPLNDLVEFQARWDKTTSSWKLSCGWTADTIKSVPGLDAAFEKSWEWAAALEPTPEEIEEDAPDEE